MLVRDVAYAQIPRAERAQKHRGAAEWIEALSERTDDVSEMLAHHYANALEFARASGQDTDELAGRARQALRAAGERAQTLGAFQAAGRFLSAALELWPDDDPELPDLQLALAEALNWAGGLSEELIVAARDGALRYGRLGLAARAEIRLGFYWWNRGENDLARRSFDAAAELVEQLPITPEKAWALNSLGVRALVTGRSTESVAAAHAAAEMAESLGLDALRAQALITLGSARVEIGEVEGIEEIERGLASGESLNAGEIVIRGYKNLGDAVQRIGELERAADLHQRGLETARRLGDAWHVRWFSGELSTDRYLAGRWDEALALADEVIAGVESGWPHYMESVCRDTRALIRLARGDVAGALADSERSLELGRSISDPQVLGPSLAVHARVLVDRDDLRGAGELVDEFETTSSFMASAGIADFAFAAVVTGRSPGFFAAARQILSTPWTEAGEAVSQRDFERAADLYGRMGSRPDEAYARLLSAKETQVRRALDFYRSVGATRYVREAESLLAASA